MSNEETIPLVIRWVKICKDDWAEGPIFMVYPIYRAANKLLHMQIETEIIREVVKKHPDTRRI